MLETFYNKVNNSKDAYIFKAILEKEMDTVEDEPIHVIRVKETPSEAKCIKAKKHRQKPPEYLYKSCDFPTVFLFGFFRKALHIK